MDTSIRFKSVLGICLAVLLAVPLYTCAEVKQPKQDDVKQSLLSIKENIGYKHLLDGLQRVVNSKGKTKENHFFVANYPASQSFTYMFWKEGRYLWLLDIGGDDPGHWRSVEFPSSGEFIQLDRDVVATPEEIGTSAYLVDQAWVNEKLYSAVIDGDLIIVKKQ